MNSLVEAVAILVLFIVTPVIVLWVLIGFTNVIGNLAELPIDESEALAVCHWGGNSEKGV